MKQGEEYFQLQIGLPRKFQSHLIPKAFQVNVEAGVVGQGFRPTMTHSRTTNGRFNIGSVGVHLNTVVPVVTVGIRNVVKELVRRAGVETTPTCILTHAVADAAIVVVVKRYIGVVDSDSG